MSASNEKSTQTVAKPDKRCKCKVQCYCGSSCDCGDTCVCPTWDK